MEIEKRMVPMFGLDVDGVFVPVDIIEELCDQDAHSVELVGMEMVNIPYPMMKAMLTAGLVIRRSGWSVYGSPELRAIFNAWTE